MSNKTEEILSHVDIVEVVEEVVGDLKAVGENFKGHCPFHADNDPSFVVSPKKQIFKCFGGGCGVGGNAANFIALHQDVSYNEALAILAKRIGKPDLAKGLIAQTYASVFDLNAIVQQMYHEVLFTRSSVSQKARLFLRDRRITQETARKFGLGYGPNAWTWLKNQSLDVEQLIEANLISGPKSKAPGRDFMKNRIVFPIHYQGKIVGFSGRSIGTSKKIAKYLNSKESDWFQKGDLLYGWHVNRKSILAAKEVVIVEGNFDVLQLYQRGIDTAVAILGSYIGPRSAFFLAKKIKKAIVFADGDAPGIDSALKTGAALVAQGIPVEVIYVEGRDPDDIAKRETRFDWEDLKNNHMQPLHLFAFEHKKLEGALEILGSYSEKVQVGYALRDLAKASGFSEDHLDRWLGKYKKSVLGVIEDITPPQQKSSLIDELIVLNSVYDVEGLLEEYEMKKLAAENVDLSIAKDPGFIASLADKPAQLERLFKFDQIEDLHEYAEDLIARLRVQLLKRDIKRWRKKFKETEDLKYLKWVERAVREVNYIQLAMRNKV